MEDHKSQCLNYCFLFHITATLGIAVALCQNPAGVLSSGIKEADNPLPAGTRLRTRGSLLLRPYTSTLGM
jgi:hypothetical protein